MFQNQYEESRYWRRKWQNHKDNAPYRNAKFLMSFEEWMKVWFDSGHAHERGRGKGKFCMARFNDAGDYVVGNVKIISFEENEAELWARPETLQRIKKALDGNSYAKGYKHTSVACIKMSINSAVAKPVICTSDGNEFLNIKAAASFYGIKTHNLEGLFRGPNKINI